MIEIAKIRNNHQELIERLRIKNFDAEKIIADILVFDKKKREIQMKSDELLSKKNTLTKEIGNLYKSGKAEEANKLKAETLTFNDSIATLKEEFNTLDKDILELLYLIPNVPNSSVPKGKTPEDNETIYEHGEIVELNKNAVPHWELASKYDLIDFDLGVKITGAGFPVYKGKGAKLQRALINFFLF